MYKEKFVLSVIHDGHPVKENGGRNDKQVAIPFGSEYKIRLKNKNDRSCTAKITIDGTPVSNFGDVIVSAGGTIDLERFIINSMNGGARFKFVDLDHSDVDDPTKSENGVVRVEFYLARQKNGIKIAPSSWKSSKIPWVPPYYGDKSDGVFFDKGPTWIGGMNSSTSEFKSSGNIDDATVMFCASGDAGIRSSSLVDTEAGATIEGGHSNQAFTYSTLDVESHATVFELKIVGIRKNRRTVPKQYCTGCGHRIRKSDIYCGGCGRKI